MSWLKLNKEGPPEHQGVRLDNVALHFWKCDWMLLLPFQGEGAARLSVCFAHTQVYERGNICHFATWVFQNSPGNPRNSFNTKRLGKAQLQMTVLLCLNSRMVDIGINCQVNMSEISSVDINWKMLTLVRPGSKTDDQFFTKWESGISLQSFCDVICSYSYFGDRETMIIGGESLNMIIFTLI